MSASAKREVPWFKIGEAPGLRFLKDQLRGLGPLAEPAQRATILDLGCAEGLIGKYYLDVHGADLVHGIELSAARVEQARRLCAGYNTAEFWQGDLDRLPDIATRVPLLPRYRIVLALAVLHKLRLPVAVLRWAAGHAEKFIAVRMPGAEKTFQDARSNHVTVAPDAILAPDFEIVSDVAGPCHERTMIYRRRAP